MKLSFLGAFKMPKSSFLMFISSLAALAQGIGGLEGEQRAAFDLLRLERQRLEFMDPRIGWRPMSEWQIGREYPIQFYKLLNQR
jgi:hypothetical protein